MILYNMFLNEEGLVILFKEDWIMQIGEVIRKYRKSMGMTQEEMANRIGVTTPAVNKWENNNSKPDIDLLAPIARLFRISLDTLLLYKEELTVDEIGGMVQALDDKLEKEGYASAFQWAEDIISEYPNCYQLIWQFAITLDAGNCLNNGALNEGLGSEKYSKQIACWHETVLKNGGEELKGKAAASLFELMFRQEKYDEAEKYLRYYSEDNPQKNLNRGRLAKVRGDIDGTYQIYERELFSAHQLVSNIFSMLYILAMETDELEKAKYYMEKQSGLAKLFEMGKYYEVSGWLDIYCKEKNIDKTLETAEILLKNINTLGNFCGNKLYMHMEFSELDDKFYNSLKNNLIELFRDKESFGFMNDNEAWKELLK